MPVSVSIPTILRSHTGGEKRVTAEGDTLAAVINDLEANYSGIAERLMDKDNPGKLNRFVNIYVNDEDVRFSGGLDTAVSDGDTITILPAVAGGTILPAVAGGTILPAVAGGTILPAVAGG